MQAALAGLGRGDRVRLIATDLNAIPLTKGFVAPQSAEWTQAMAALDERTPLGSNDMEKALTAAAASFGADSKNPRAVIYIGDGSSRANLLSPEKIRQLTASLADRHIPVVSYGVGPRVDRQILGILAQQTGGLVLDEPQGGSAADTGRQLAAATAATVAWPTAAVKWPAEVGEVIPKTVPPLRSDRDTVLIGTLKGKEPLRIDASVDAPGGAKTLSWTAAVGKSMDDNNYLPALVEQARSDGGLSMPLVGSASLALVRQQIQAGGRTMNQLAQQAIASKNLDGAERLADAALQRDPGDPEALAVKGAVARARQGGRDEGGGEYAAASQRAGRRWSERGRRAAGRRRWSEPGRPAAGRRSGRRGPCGSLRRGREGPDDRPPDRGAEYRQPGPRPDADQPRTRHRDAAAGNGEDQANSRN